MISHRYRVGLLVLVVLVGTIFAIGTVSAASLAQPALLTPTPPSAPTPGAAVGPSSSSSQPFDPQSYRQRDEVNTEAPEISFIDSPSATCYLPRPGTDTCYITWNYLYVTADASQYIISMTVNIDNHNSAYFSGFFQNSMYIPGSMLNPGFRVACGTPGSGGNPYLGKQYPYTIRARETGGLRSANYGSVTCPADFVPLDSTILSGPAIGKPQVEAIFTATAYPITATLPVTYVWQATGYPVITDTNGISASRAFSWSTYGVKTVKVTLSNPVSSRTKTRTITIEPYRIFLPMQKK